MSVDMSGSIVYFDDLLDQVPLAMKQVFLLLPIEDLCTCLNSVSPRWTSFIKTYLLEGKENRRVLDRRKKLYHW